MVDQANSQSIFPINELPSELLEKIIHQGLLNIVPSFKAISDHKVIGAYYRRLTRLSLVCRHWALLITTTPSFWAIISASIPYKALEVYLKRSGGHVIDLECSTWNRNLRRRRGCSRRELQTFCKTVVHHLSKCRSIYFQCFLEDWSYFVGLLETPAPRLRSITLRVTEANAGHLPVGEDEPPPLNLFAGQVSNLAFLNLHAVGLDWPSIALPGLISLKLDSIYGHGPPAGVVVGIVQSCPGLETIYLSVLISSPEAPDPTFSIKPIDLPKLRTLVVEECSLVLTEGVLASIKSMAQCTTLRLTFKLEGNIDGQYLDSTFHHLLPDMRRLLQMEFATSRNLLLEIETDFHDILWSSDGYSRSNFRLHVRGPDSSRVAAVKLVAFLIEQTDIAVSLVVAGDELHPRQADSELLGAIQTLPITQLCLRNMEDWEPWLSYLSAFCFQAGQPQTVVSRPFKDMTELILSEGGSDFNTLNLYQSNIQSMLKERYSPVDISVLSPSHGTIPEGYHQPKALKAMTYNGKIPISKEVADEIEEILGQGIFEEDVDAEDEDEENWV